MMLTFLARPLVMDGPTDIIGSQSMRVDLLRNDVSCKDDIAIK